MLRRMIAALLALAALTGAAAETERITGEGESMPTQIDIRVEDRTMTAVLADNASAEAFAQLLAEGPVTVAMHDYGGFEKVGPLPEELPRSDARITTAPGDIILYLGSSITIYYDVNTWEFTLLGHIEGADGESMRAFLGAGNPEVTFSLRAEE